MFVGVEHGNAIAIMLIRVRRECLAVVSEIAARKGR
jgi:hypothetical protein